MLSKLNSYFQHTLRESYISYPLRSQPSYLNNASLDTLPALLSLLFPTVCPRSFVTSDSDGRRFQRRVD